MNRSLRNRFFLILALLAIAVYYVYPPDKKITLGLDLKGGTAYTLQMDLTRVEPVRRPGMVDKAVDVLRKRLDSLGLTEPSILPQGQDRIVVQMPGLDPKDKARTRAQLERVAKLELRLVHPENDQEMARMKREGGLPPPGYEVMKLKEKREDKDIEEELLVKIKPELTGNYLSSAYAGLDAGGYHVSFHLTSEGAKIFGNVTEENVGHRLAIVLDKTLISAPVIQSKITSDGQITGSFDQKEAMDLASALENPLETPIKVIEERGVDPSLGADSIKSGIMAGLVGLALVIAFMALYYLRAGLIANMALLVNVALLFGVLAIFKFTLTLPGVAGIILTVGIAVDANVLIYERIREELRKGKSIQSAIDAGYNRAFGTIIDANVTTLITALVLTWLGKGPVQGFGVTLSAGIITSVFSAVVVTRLIYDFLLLKGRVKNFNMLSLVQQTQVPFLNYKIPAFALSIGIILAGAAVGYNKGKEIYGVDFTGGDSLTLKFSKRVDISDLRNTLQASGLKEVFLQYQREVQGGGETLFMKVPFGSGTKAEETFQHVFPQAGFVTVKTDQVGGSVGDELKWAALKGLLVAAVAILVYVTLRFEFAYAVGAIVALLHDVLICLAFVFFTGRQLSLPTIGALLTIAGYSLNDTIVVFDRIREEFKLKGEKFGFTNLINLSVNETLSRTLLTSFTAFIASLSLYVFGGGVINDFAFILVVGVITGTYSSVFIASPILLFWHPSQLAPQEKQAGIGAQRQVG